MGNNALLLFSVFKFTTSVLNITGIGAGSSAKVRMHPPQRPRRPTDISRCRRLPGKYHSFTLCDEIALTRLYQLMLKHERNRRGKMSRTTHPSPGSGVTSNIGRSCRLPANYHAFAAYD